MSSKEKYLSTKKATGDAMHQKHIQKLIETEGRSARNLVSWNVPFESDDNSYNSPEVNDRNRYKSKGSSSKTSENDHAQLKRCSSKENREQKMKAENEGTPKKSNRTAVSEKTRFWTYLIDNLDRAVDALYSVCDQNESIQQANEMKMILATYLKDFDNLIDKIKIQEEFDKAEEKPLSISWEVRKTSSPMKAPAAASLVDSSGSMRQLVFMSWADRVKGASQSMTGQTQSPDRSLVKESKSYASTMNQNQSENDEQGTVANGANEEGTETNNEEAGWEKYSKHKVNKTRDARNRRRPKEVGEGTNVDNMSNSEDSAGQSKSEASATAADTKSGEIKEDSGTSGSELTPMKKLDSLKEGVELEEEEEEEESNEETDRDSEIDEQLNECYDRALEQCEEEEIQLVHQLEDMSLQDVPEAPQDEESDVSDLEGGGGEEGSKRSKNTQTQKNGPACNGSTVNQESMTGDFGSFDIQASWADLVEQEEQDQKMCNRDPSRALIIHERLSSPSRTTSWAEKKWRHEEKQRKAQEIRAKALEETMLKQRNLALRIQEVRRWKHEILHKKKAAYEQKLELAEDKRKAHLRKIVKKAHEEENKVNEIAFIMTLEAQNRRAEMKSKHEVYEARKQELEEGRLRKLEETRALEEAAKERRKNMELEKESRLSEMQARRETHMQRITALQVAKDQERMEATRKREEEREKKLALVVERERDAVEGLVKRLQEKQDESEARYKQLLSERQQRAAELAHGPNSNPLPSSHCAQGSGDAAGPNGGVALATDPLERKTSVGANSVGLSHSAPSIEAFANPKMCFLCNVELKSEVHLTSHQKGKKHIEAMRKELNRSDVITEQESERLSVKFIGDVVSSKEKSQIELDFAKQKKERLENMKKKLKKVRARMNQRAKEFELRTTSSDQFKSSSALLCENKTKIQKVLKEINKLISAPGSGVWAENKVASLDRHLGELDRMFAKTAALKNLEGTGGEADRVCFREQSGYAIVCRVLMIGNENCDKSTSSVSSPIPTKSQSLAASVLLNSCLSTSTDNCRYLLYSNKISPLIDVVSNQLTSFLKEMPPPGPIAVQPLPRNQIVQSVCTLITVVLESVVRHALSNEVVTPSATGKSNKNCAANNSVRISRPAIEDQFKSRVLDVVSYVVCSGLVDKISQVFVGVRKSVYSDSEGASLLSTLMHLVTQTTLALQTMLCQSVMEAVTDDFTYLVSTVRATELLGCVSLLYGTLLHSDVVHKQHSSTAQLSDLSLVDAPLNCDLNRKGHHAVVPPQHVLKLACSTLGFINAVALLDTPAAQEVLSEESLSLQLRHIASSLFNNCASLATNLQQSQSQPPGCNARTGGANRSGGGNGDTTVLSSLCASLIHEVILTIGYFTLLNSDNQLIIQAGSPPTLLQQLCTALPFHYFSDDVKMDVLFPTLIACCHGNDANRNILQTEITPSLLVNYLKSKKEKVQSQPAAENALLLISGCKFDLVKRFPISRWQDAIDFFSS